MAGSLLQMLRHYGHAAPTNQSPHWASSQWDHRQGSRYTLQGINPWALLWQWCLMNDNDMCAQPHTGGVLVVYGCNWHQAAATFFFAARSKQQSIIASPLMRAMPAAAIAPPITANSRMLRKAHATGGADPQGLHSGGAGGVALSAVWCSCSKPALTTSRRKLQAGQDKPGAGSPSHPQPDPQSNMLLNY